MANEPSSPTLLSRELGARLKELRLTTNLTISQVAERMLCAESTISRIENGKRRPSERDVRDLCMIYGAGKKTHRELDELRQEARQPVWWQQRDIPYTTFIGLEQAASTIRNYETSFVPGLLQTEGYARYTLRALRPFMDPGGEDPIDSRVVTRLNRQRILERTSPPPPMLHLLVDESTFLRDVGEPGVMEQQIDALINFSELPNITLQVIPFSVGIHPGLDSGSFVYFEFASTKVPDKLYLEGLFGNVYIEREADLTRHRQIFDYLAELALDPTASIQSLDRMRRELQS